ncbi:uncharacterized protein K452DRAFT_225171 [Aplosporella prunicola CBS 121167]|uniref:Cellulose-binding family II protein n=1 Tax=Aplosporella prunicola CBS 121167 TaxID=1176127 RepID=A0A6A6BKY4_9PEZI|nr:uncharacterized protein K452DRAFT_225171 [Aplosporella prunicola CBS 121167]KAF2143517.1 hypothetical protein K452DRAFT_225171 [Aplosporella prunicola CBS 121167]
MAPAALAHPLEARADDAWNPPSELVTPLKQTWDWEMKSYSDPLGFKNYGFDQVFATDGKINYCVRWESDKTISADDRTNIETALRRSMNKWIAKLKGWNGWPYDTLDINVVGYAVKDKSLLQGDTSGLQIYTDTDTDGIPQCSEDCGRFFHTDGDYSSCPAGADRHYDQSLWLTEGMGMGGAGGDWGQRVDRQYFMDAVKDEDIHIILHEMGHTFALSDFYDFMPDGVTEFVMNAGSSMKITEFDGWMLRDWWRNLKSRYNL